MRHMFEQSKKRESRLFRCSESILLFHMYLSFEYASVAAIILQALFSPNNLRSTVALVLLAFSSQKGSNPPNPATILWHKNYHGFT